MLLIAARVCAREGGCVGVAGEAVLVWMGTGLSAIGLVDGSVLDEEGKVAVRRVMAGCHPAPRARLFRGRTSVRAHEKAKRTTARLVEAIEAAAAEHGVEPADLLEARPQKQKVLAQQQRMVHRLGEMHRMQVTTLHKLAQAAPGRVQPYEGLTTSRRTT
ncbi:hypothetical protein ABZV67_43385 [Streptomyces sp. NPDC005065]|uniref:hypothetical protein n=1 Tax=Streptomyces sp. NPDC005065 TaxID=3154461 RepID=UPI0033B06F44